jgi:integrase
MQVSLTDRFCDRAKAQGPQTDYFDENVSGLALRVAKSGRKTWSFHFTSPRTSKRARLTIGSYPATSLAAARSRALEAKGEVEAGADPRTTAKAEMTVAELVASYLDNYVRPNLRSAKDLELRVNRNVLPVLGGMKLTDLHRRDMNRVIDPIIKRDAPAQASNVFKDLYAIMQWAVGRGDLDHNPFQGMSKPATPKPRERTLTVEEIATLWAALPTAFSITLQQIIKLCLITAQRVGEVSGMRRSELDLKQGIWLLPGKRTKNTYSHSVPLTDLALDVIAGGGDDLVFGPLLQVDNIAHTIERAQSRVGIPHWTCHDLRRTALTQMAALGIPPIVLGHVANHRTTTKAGVTLAVYSHYDYAKEKREALELWADRLRGIVTGKAAEVVAIRRGQR